AGAVTLTAPVTFVPATCSGPMLFPTVPWTQPGNDTPLGNARKPAAALAADFNHDGKPDLVLANNPDNSVTMHVANGDGTFSRAMIYAAEDYDGHALYADDFDRDGWLDLAVLGGSGAANFSVLLGRGDGTLRAPTVFQVGSVGTGITGGDFNHDGKPDL